jgi:predicted outer membrane repeat protein
MLLMNRLWWLFLPLAFLANACADSVPVECPEGTELSKDDVDCAAEMSGNPDAGTDMPDAGPDTPDAGPDTRDDPPKCDEADCDDGNECTVDGCDGEECASVTAEDGTACVFEDAAGVCESGACVRDCEIEDCRVVYPCSEQGLRDAVEDGGEIVIGCNGPTTLLLENGELEMLKDVSIDGLGLLTVDGQGFSRVFAADETARVELIGINITGGNAGSDSDGNGGGVYGTGNTEITLRGCTVYGNTAVNYGGGIRTSGQLYLEDTTVTNNSSERHGGGIALWQGAVISDSVISDNATVGRGGGVYVVLSATFGSTPITIRDSVFARNQAGTTGGAIWTKDTLTVERSTFEDNSAVDGGGGIRNFEASVTIRESNFEGNHAHDGGGIANYRAKETIVSGTRFVDNWTTGGSGAAVFNDETRLEVVDCSFEENRAVNAAGAVYSKYSETRFSGSTFSDNVATLGGAFRFYGNTVDRIDARFENCTISGNTATDYAGASADRNAKVQLFYTTLTGNTAPNAGRGIHQIEGAVLEASHSLIDAECASDPDSTLVSLGYNAILSSNGDECTLTPIDGMSTDLELTLEEMALGPLAENGAETRTHIPATGSPLIDAIPAESCLPETEHDQRGEPRGGGACDIGAVEVQAGE